MRANARWIEPASVLGLLLVASASSVPVAAQAEDDGEPARIEGSVEVAYRATDVDGSERKYDEDFDGLGSGTYLSSLRLAWLDEGADWLDYARLELDEFGGGEPSQHGGLRFGRKDAFDLSVRYRRQDSLYDLFGLAGDEDGHQWDTERETTEVDLRLFATERTTVVFGYHNADRTGDSVHMKDIQRELFLLDSPVDFSLNRYTVGADFRFGEVDVIFRQARQRTTNDVEQSVEGSLGIDPVAPAELFSYDWSQRESSTADLTTLRVRTPLGRRFDLTVGVFGTLVGNEELESDVAVDALGLDFAPAPFAIVGGTSDVTTEADHLRLDADLSVLIADPVSLHLQYSGYDRDLSGVGTLDLDGEPYLVCAVTGAVCTTSADCDPLVPGDVCTTAVPTADPVSVDTRLDWSIDTLTGLVEWRPTRRVNLRAGIRTIDRSLERSGFDAQRDQDFESDGDETLVVGLAWHALGWLHVNADYEDGELDHAFTAVAPFESERARVRVGIEPQDGMRVDLSWLDFENTNTSDPTRAWYGRCAATGAVCTDDTGCGPGDTCVIEPFDHTSEGTSWSAGFWHRANDSLDWSFRYAEQEMRIRTDVLFDGAGFGGPAAFGFGTSVFDDTDRQWSAQINFRPGGGPWSTYARYTETQSEGENLLDNRLGAPFSTFEAAFDIDQDYTDWELGAQYLLRSGLWLGGSWREFDYEDDNPLLDYDGSFLTVRAGLRF